MFLAFFVHPDGTCAGEYGSRRTALYYPGGLALLADEFPLAASMTRFMLRSITEHRTTTIQDVDMGNLAPLLSSYLLALDATSPEIDDLPMLPCEQEVVCVNFRRLVCLYVAPRDTTQSWGLATGGVLKVFDRNEKGIIWNDAGYVGQDKNRRWLTTQMTVPGRLVTVDENSIALEVPPL